MPSPPLIEALKHRVAWLPTEEIAWRKVRDRWIEVIAASQLTTAEKLVAIILALQFINRNPKHKWFNWGWPSQTTLARRTGLSRRTVSSALSRLEQANIIVVVRSDGKRPGAVLRYTLRTDQLDHFAMCEKNQTDKREKFSHTLPVYGEVHGCAINDSKVCKSEQEPVQRLLTIPTTNSENYSLEGAATANEGGEGPLAWREANGVRPQISIKPSIKEKRLTATDQAELARYLGSGDICAGFEILGELPTDTLDRWTRTYDTSRVAGGLSREAVKVIVKYLPCEL